MSQYLVSEVFDMVEKAKTKEEKISVLRTNNFLALQAMLQLCYDPHKKLLLPEGTPPYKKEEDKPIGYQQTSLNLELRRFYIWLDPSQNIPNLKKEKLFIEMLEGLHYTEAELLCAAKDRRLTFLYNSLTEELVREAFPALLPPPVKSQEVTKTKKPLQKKLKNTLEVSLQ